MSTASLDLAPIEERDARARVVNDIGSPIMACQDRRDLLAEVKRLRDELDTARRDCEATRAELTTLRLAWDALSP